MSEENPIRDELLERLREEVGSLTSAYENGKIATIANLYSALQAIDFVNKNGGSLEKEITENSFKIIG